MYANARSSYGPLCELAELQQIRGKNNNMLETSALPSSPEAEQGVLSSFLQSPDKVAEMCNLQNVTETWFFHPIYIEVFQGLMRMHKEHRAIDVTTATDFFSRYKEEFRIHDPMQTITELFCYTPSATNVSHYLEIMRECYAQRLGIIACKEAEGSIRSAKSLQDVFNATVNPFRDTMKVCEEKDARDWDKDMLLEFADEMEAIMQGKLVTKYIKTHLSILNDKVGGINPGEEIIVIGKASTGKSALGWNFIRECSMVYNKRSAVFSAEMGHKQCIRRLLSDTANISLRNMRIGSLTDQEMKSFMSGMTRISKAPISIYDAQRIAMSPDAIEAEIRRLKKNKKGLEMVMIDYLQLLKTKSKKEQRRDEELSGVTAQFKQLAQELDISVILIAAENKEGGVRGSEGCEFDSDGILKMMPVKNKDNRVISSDGIFIEKWREGERGYVIPTTLIGEYSRIVEDLTRKPE